MKRPVPKNEVNSEMIMIWFKIKSPKKFVYLGFKTSSVLVVM